MNAPTPYLHFPGTAREALTFYSEVFGTGLRLHTFQEFNRPSLREGRHPMTTVRLHSHTPPPGMR